MTATKAAAVLWLVVILSALAVVYASHRCRLLYSELAILQQTENNLQVAWGQYLLEQSSLASLSRIEKIAINELGMRVPEIKEVIMVQP
ncbi:MAG: cell division protein FtsL [Porticoccaceae bacterium]